MLDCVTKINYEKINKLNEVKEKDPEKPYCTCLQCFPLLSRDMTLKPLSHFIGFQSKVGKGSHYA